MFGLTNGKWMTCQATANHCWHRSIARPFRGGDSSCLQWSFVLTTAKRVEKLRRPLKYLSLWIWGLPNCVSFFKGLAGPRRGRSKCPGLLQAIGRESLNLSHSEPALCVWGYIYICIYIYTHSYILTATNSWAKKKRNHFCSVDLKG